MGGYIEAAEKRNNRILNGVEVDKKGRHHKYYIIKPDGMSWDIVDAIGKKTGRVQAFLLYSNK